jgi:hypothetical protein
VLIMEGEEQDAFEGKERALVSVMGERDRMFLKGRKGQFTWSACYGGEEQDAFEGKERAIVPVMEGEDRMLLKGRKGH